MPSASSCYKAFAITLCYDTGPNLLTVEKNLNLKRSRRQKTKCLTVALLDTEMGQRGDREALCNNDLTLYTKLAKIRTEPQI